VQIQLPNESQVQSQGLLQQTLMLGVRIGRAHEAAKISAKEDVKAVAKNSAKEHVKAVAKISAKEDVKKAVAKISAKKRKISADDDQPFSSEEEE
jgi:hypothetical protein